jgi:hypothetical protein
MSCRITSSLSDMSLAPLNLRVLVPRKDKHSGFVLRFVMLTKEASHSFPYSRDSRYEFPRSSGRQIYRIWFCGFFLAFCYAYVRKHNIKFIRYEFSSAELACPRSSETSMVVFTLRLYNFLTHLNQIFNLYLDVLGNFFSR